MEGMHTPLITNPPQAQQQPQVVVLQRCWDKSHTPRSLQGRSRHKTSSRSHISEESENILSAQLGSPPSSAKTPAVKGVLQRSSHPSLQLPSVNRQPSPFRTYVQCHLQTGHQTSDPDPAPHDSLASSQPGLAVTSGTGFLNSEQAGGTNSRWLSLSPQQFNRSGLDDTDVLHAIYRTSPAALQGEQAAPFQGQPSRPARLQRFSSVGRVCSQDTRYAYSA